MSVQKKKMVPIVKAKWVAALRSGEYLQGKGYLFNSNKYCCLGVLIDLYIKEQKSDENIEYFGREIFENDHGYALQTPGSSYLGAKMCAWSGLPNVRLGGDGEISLNNLQRFLSDHNDGNSSDKADQWDFNQIADWVENNL